MLEYAGMTSHEFDWDSSYEIVLELSERYPDEDVSELGLDDLYKRIVALPGFVGEAAMVNDKILRDILRDWYEEIGD